MLRRWTGTAAAYAALSLATAATAAEPLRPISTVTVGYHAKYDTIAHALLNDEAAAATVTQRMYDFVDALIDAAQKRIPLKSHYTSDDALAAVEAIDETLTDMNVVYPADDTAMGEVDLLSDGLRGRIMNGAEIDALLANPHNRRRVEHIKTHAKEPFFVNDCDTTSFLYLAVAEALGLPLSMVDLPGHNFVRFEADGNRFDWETMDAAVEPASYYQTEWRIPDELIANRVYLVGMSRADIIGYHFTLTSAIWRQKHRDRRMLDDDEKAAALYPRGPRVWNQWAWDLVTATDPALRDGKIALDYAARAVAISRTPNDLDTLACAYAATGDFPPALGAEQDAAALAKTSGFPLEPGSVAFQSQIRRFDEARPCSESLSVVAPQANVQPHDRAGGKDTVDDPGVHPERGQASSTSGDLGTEIQVKHEPSIGGEPGGER